MFIERSYSASLHAGVDYTTVIDGRLGSSVFLPKYYQKKKKKISHNPTAQDLLPKYYKHTKAEIFNGSYVNKHRNPFVKPLPKKKKKESRDWRSCDPEES